MEKSPKDALPPARGEGGFARARPAPQRSERSTRGEWAAPWAGAGGPPNGTSTSGPDPSSSSASGAPAPTAAACTEVPRAPAGHEGVAGHLEEARTHLWHGAVV